MMGITAMLNRIAQFLGKNDHFEREKKIPLFELVVSMVTSFSVCQKTKSIADIRKNFIKHTGKTVSRSSFWERLANENLLEFLEKAIFAVSFQLQQATLSKLISQLPFNDILIYDSTPIRLPKKLSEVYPGNRTNHSPACLKLSALYQLTTRSIKWMTFAAQKIHDSQVLPDIERLKGSLFLFDLGYFSHLFLKQLDSAGVWFVCRLKDNSIPKITRVISGISPKYNGAFLTPNIVLTEAIVELWATLTVKGETSMTVRLIGFRFPETGEYRWYATNLAPAQMLAEWIYPIYRLRWQIELFFKSIKSTLHADQITSGNANIALSLAYSSILAALIANYLLIGRSVLSSCIELKEITAQRLMKVFSLLAFNLAQCLLSREIKNKSFEKQIDNLLHLLVCPNRKHRPTSLVKALNLIC